MLQTQSKESRWFAEGELPAYLEEAVGIGQDPHRLFASWAEGFTVVLPIPLAYGLVVTDTLSKVALARVLVLPLVTARPTYTVCPMLMVWLVAICTQVTPSAET